MGRQKKRKTKGSKAKSDASQPPKNPKSNPRWDKQLTEALDILDSWAAVEDSELTTVLTQLASILQMRAESDAASSSALPADRIATALELACSHDRPEVRSAGWEAAHECSLIEPELCESLVGRGTLFKSGFEQLQSATEAVPRHASLIGFLQLTCEASEEAVASVGAAEVDALLAAASRVAVPRARAAALELLLVLADPTVEDEDGQTIGAALADKQEWRDAMAAALDACAPPAPEPTPSTAETSEALEAAKRVQQVQAEEAAWLVRTLAACLVLSVYTCSDALMATLIATSVHVLAATLNKAAKPDAPSEIPSPPPDAAVRQALEALANRFLLRGPDSADGTEVEYHIDEILPFGKLLSLLMAMLSVCLKKPDSGSSTAVGSSSQGQQEEPDDESGVFGRLMRCIGAVISTAVPVHLEQHLAISKASWNAYLAATDQLHTLSPSKQCEALELWNLIVSRSIPYSVNLDTAGSVHIWKAIDQFKLWPRRVDASATALSLSLLGQLTPVARKYGEEGSEYAKLITDELLAWTRVRAGASRGELICAAEAAAAVADDWMTLTEEAGAAKPELQPELRRTLESIRDQLQAAVASPRKGSKRAREGEEEEETVAHALELVEAALS